jgi:16S rRNA G1207 methylase RsmC
VEKALGQTLTLDVPWDVFSSQRIDDGTLLLLKNLPEGEPRSLLDLGCGYGALGLPIATRWPAARCLLVDRDLLAVAASDHNARALKLGNVEVRPGLGYHGLPERFDWVLCNVPARIGERAIRYLLTAAPGATMRAVVIRDLAEVAAKFGRRVATGARHVVFEVAERSPALSDQVNTVHPEDAVYGRDRVELLGLHLDRPHDVSEDPSHFRALSVLADSLPRAAPARAFVFRAGYGALPLLLKSRWPASQVVAQERDLLEAAFIRKNAPGVEVRETLFPAEGISPHSFDLVLGELSSPAGPAVAARELKEAAELLAPGGQALVLASEKQVGEWELRSARATVLLTREGASVLRISRSRE